MFVILVGFVKVKLPVPLLILKAVPVSDTEPDKTVIAGAPPAANLPNPRLDPAPRVESNGILYFLKQI
jgi:hypothetical protein